MKLERLEWVVLKVPDIEKGVIKFGDILGIEFEKIADVILPNGTTVRCAYSSQGVELVEASATQDTVIGGVHFRVTDLVETEEWIETYGGKIVGEISVGKMDILISSISEIQICFICYLGDSYIKAIG